MYITHILVPKPIPSPVFDCPERKGLGDLTRVVALDWKPEHLQYRSLFTIPGMSRHEKYGQVPPPYVYYLST